MRKTITLLATAALIGSLLALPACNKGGSDQTNVVEMNAMDGSMNDMTVVDSATLDAAGSANMQNDTAGNTASGNASNAM
jgi:uncharacterized protein involved in copper resistance